MYLEIENNQKKVLLDKISEIIKRFNVKSVLDIGAGQPVLAMPISKLVDKYIGIENNPDRIEQLRDAGLEIIDRRFPDINISDKFDLVLSSHSIPENIYEYKDFFKKAWDLVNNDGRLVVITFKGIVDDLDNLKAKLRKINVNDDKSKYDEMFKILSNFGEVEREIITSETSTVDIEQMLDLLSFSIGGTENDKLLYKGKLKDILSDKYKIDGKYYFPHNHYVLMVKKYNQSI